ncbi:hypothetical protein GCM10018790_48680 [Kitasatospora xanthocidica]|uniref:hypothetical protein n=1 Tax=Kitasatospora xanthocidica TaxID=83382 RepID=UPI0019C01EB2|nr:hypothetical protein [Kitasatospora xanthocidica]GHF65086.1 hypothetical protein GCM10018790_48680 [Kitasatospora xanthocidica]
MVRLAVPARGVEQEALLDPPGLLAQLGREGGAQFQPGGGERLAETELGGGARERGEEGGLRLVGGQPGEPGPDVRGPPLTCGA